jgi:hypothetical protein
MMSGEPGILAEMDAQLPLLIRVAQVCHLQEKMDEWSAGTRSGRLKSEQIQRIRFAYAVAGVSIGCNALETSNFSSRATLGHRKIPREDVVIETRFIVLQLRQRAWLGVLLKQPLRT